MGETRIQAGCRARKTRIGVVLAAIAGLTTRCGPAWTAPRSSLAPQEPSLPQRLLDWVLASPLYSLILVPQARRTMVQTAAANGIQWDAALKWIKAQDPWDESTLARAASGQQGLPSPSYYRKPFHAYESGNLNWEAAFEQELASRAVGARNFPQFGERGEEAFRGAFDAALASLGASVPDTGLLVDLGCGTGTSTRRLAASFPNASRVLGMDLSPYFIAVGRRLLELCPGPEGPWVTAIQPDSRIELIVGDAADTRLPDGHASVVNLGLVLHELPREAARAVCAEAFRILAPGGQLWISEMDFSAPAYAELRENKLLFSLIRATEPYLDEYADSAEELLQEYLVEGVGFESVRVTAATGRHFAVVATKGSGVIKSTNGSLDDYRFDEAGAYAVQDTHLKTWESKSNS